MQLEDSRGAGAQAWDCKRDRFWVRFPLEEMKCLIMPRSGSEAKCSIEFRYLTLNISKIRRRVENGSILTGTFIILGCKVPFLPV